LFGFLVLEYFFESKIELAHIILAEAVLVPAYNIEDKAVYRGDREILDDIPLRVEVLRYGMGSGTRFTEVEDEILLA
jgi:hypothetical protein